MSRTAIAAGVVLAALAGVSAASAQVLTQKSISAALASDLALETVAQCKAKGYGVSVTVLDQSGVLKAFVRGDTAHVITVEVSRLKAATAVGLGIPTARLAAAVAKGGDATNILHLPGVIALAGGLPLKSGDQVVGSIGVSGAPGGQLDEECFNAALAKHGARLN